ncbi:hypothetical protein BDP27DRAFT_1461899 [Rhodocollybia butyracea]|uniref:Uncharacterized protein n=1 Tax=Rhodocollybia butyracea TaxID=206335 RepID=A0A9P5U4H1_9AGAR|nr:hypothetical protein BDP27DRAFT_1461899 [Rhodocollybia butyracea]
MVAKSCFIQLRSTREVVFNLSIFNYTDSPTTVKRETLFYREKPIRNPRAGFSFRFVFPNATFINPKAKTTLSSTVNHSLNTHGKRHPTVAAQQKPCSYTGHFNLYAMDHQDLCEIYRPAGSSKPRYEVLYRHLRGLETSSDAPVSTSTSSYASPSPSPAPFPRFSQNDPELETETCVQKLTATITLPPTPYGRKFGSAHAPCLHDPVTHHPYPLELSRISPVNQVFYRDAEKECFATRHSDDVSMVGKLPGVSARVGVCVGESDVRRKGKTGELESAGGFHMSRVWEGVDANADTEKERMERIEKRWSFLKGIWG